MMINNELKPCPFCGGEAEITKWHEGYFVECREQRCGGTIGAYKTEEEAIETWNTRAERTCKIDGTYDDEFGIYDHLSCGHVAMRQWPEKTSYCPNCGAKVIADEG